MDVIKELRGKYTTATGIGHCLGISARRVQQLVHEGAIPQPTNGKYSIADSMYKYCQFLRNGLPGEDTLDLDAERAKHEALKRQLTELKLAKEEGRLHDAKQVEMMVGGMLTVFKRRLQAMPHKMAIILQNKTLDEINELLSNEIYAILVELSEYEVTEFIPDGDDDETEPDDDSGEDA
ncbi:hypothetical protein [Anaeroselena agilis]|uniref:Uncharacterized protein n=1 Tax=Anaeroselena agilis TaxID=3063788 RepID=A0ABU3NZU8_9FIRM|nr:hypothetical protein [Selenomonadales bacterium 4137-cl]